MAAEERLRWIGLIKKLRVEHGVTLFEAEKLAWAQPEWRRWVEGRINSDPQCRKMAMRHVRDHGADSLIDERDGRLTVKGGI